MINKLLSGATWDFIKSNVDKSYPLIIDLQGDSKYKNHSMLCGISGMQ